MAIGTSDGQTFDDRWSYIMDQLGQGAFPTKLAKPMSGNPPEPNPESKQLQEKINYDDTERKRNRNELPSGVPTPGLMRVLPGAPTYEHGVGPQYKPFARVSSNDATLPLGASQEPAGALKQGEGSNIPIDNTHDVPYGAGASNKGDIVHIDKSIPQFDERLKTPEGQPADLHKYLAIHELMEKHAMDHGMTYEHAHSEIATPAERKAVEADGVDWKEYSDIIDGHLKKTEGEIGKDANVPSDLYLKPYPHKEQELLQNIQDKHPSLHQRIFGGMEKSMRDYFVEHPFLSIIAESAMQALALGGGPGKSFGPSATIGAKPNLNASPFNSWRDFGMYGNPFNRMSEVLGGKGVTKSTMASTWERSPKVSEVHPNGEPPTPANTNIKSGQIDQPGLDEYIDQQWKALVRAQTPGTYEHAVAQQSRKKFETIEGGKKDPPETVATAASRYAKKKFGNEPEIITGHNHWEDIVNKAQKKGYDPHKDLVDDGFVTNTGRFISRKEAFDMLKKTNPDKLSYSAKKDGQLISEDINSGFRWNKKNIMRDNPTALKPGNRRVPWGHSPEEIDKMAVDEYIKLMNYVAEPPP